MDSLKFPRHMEFEVQNFQSNGQAGKDKCAVDITAAIAAAGIAASLITISATARIGSRQ